VLYTSGYTENAIIHHGRLDEDVALLSKPYGKGELARKLRLLLDHPPGPKAESQPPKEAARELRLLVVEDDALLRLSTVDMLIDLGHAVEEAGDGAAAMALVERIADFDAALVDVGLPGIRGEDLIAEIRRRRPRLGIIVTTGYTAAALRFDLASTGNIVFVGKPYDAAALRKAFATLADFRQRAAL
jgi:CheY-like chemotaxis protein